MSRIAGLWALLSSFAFASPIEEAQRLLREGNYDKAIKLLADFLKAHPKEKEGLLWLGYAYEVKGERELAADAYAKAVQAGAGQKAQKALRRLFSGRFPRWLTEEVKRSIPLPFEELKLDFEDPLSPEGAPRSIETLYTKGLTYTEEIPVTAPRRAEKFNRVLYGYVKEGQRWMLRAAVFYKSRFLSKSQRDFLDLAQKVMESLLRLVALGRFYLDRGPEWAGKDFVKVWLCEEGEGGAEQWSENIFIYSVGGENPSCERLRQLAHEYGHLLLPGINEFDQPEKWANGHVGEALFLWMAAKNPSLWPRKESTPFLPSFEELSEYVKRRYTPVASSFLDAGPQSPLLFDRTEKGMWYLAGLFLFALRGLHPSPLRQFLKEFSGISPYEVMLQMSRVSWELSRQGTSVRAGWQAGLKGADPEAPLPVEAGREVLLWVPVDAGDYRATLTGKGKIEAILSLRGPSNRELPVSIGVLSPRFSLLRGWYEARLRVVSASSGATLEALHLLPTT